jgi:hypothetical protein
MDEEHHAQPCEYGAEVDHANEDVGSSLISYPHFSTGSLILPQDRAVSAFPIVDQQIGFLPDAIESPTTDAQYDVPDSVMSDIVIMSPPPPPPRHQTSATTKMRNRRWLTADWEERKPLIHRLYLEEDKPLKDVLESLAESGFDAT